MMPDFKIKVDNSSNIFNVSEDIDTVDTRANDARIKRYVRSCELIGD